MNHHPLPREHNMSPVQLWIAGLSTFLKLVFRNTKIMELHIANVILLYPGTEL